MEKAFVFDGSMAILSSIEPEEFALHLPKAKNSPALIADFLDSVPGIEVEKVNKVFRHSDVISFRSHELQTSEVVEEVINAISDVYDTDVQVCRHVPSHFPEYQ